MRQYGGLHIYHCYSIFDSLWFFDEPYTFGPSYSTGYPGESPLHRAK